MKTIVLTYHNGGFGPTEHFYEERLTIGKRGVDFYRKWEINREENREERDLLIKPRIDFDDPFEPEPKTDFSWKCEPAEPMRERCASAIAEILYSIVLENLIEDLNNQVCDGDSMEVRILMDNDDRIEFDVCWCSLPSKYKQAVRKELAKIVPAAIPLPAFLR
jgi:hypothetical protein